MSRVEVSVDGHTYRLACGEGEEARITALAAELDTTIKSLKAKLGEIGDRRLAVMSGLMVLDRLQTVEERADALAERLSRTERARDEAVARATTEKGRADMLAARVQKLERAREEAVLAAGEDDEAVLARLAAATATVERLTALLHRDLRDRSSHGERRSAAVPLEARDADAGPGAGAVDIIPDRRP